MDKGLLMDQRYSITLLGTNSDLNSLGTGWWLRAMKNWNVVVTSYRNKERQLLRELEGLGEFIGSGFRDVILGKVPEVGDFFESLNRCWEERPFFRYLLSSVVPLLVVFPFTTENLLKRLKQEALALGPEIGNASFYVRMKRRGHKGIISSMEVEQALDKFLLDELAARGQKCKVDFTSAEIIVMIEAIHTQCGLGLVTQEMKDRFPFIKVK